MLLLQGCTHLELKQANCKRAAVVSRPWSWHHHRQPEEATLTGGSGATCQWLYSQHDLTPGLRQRLGFYSHTLTHHLLVVMWAHGVLTWLWLFICRPSGSLLGLQMGWEEDWALCSSWRFEGDTNQNLCRLFAAPLSFPILLLFNFLPFSQPGEQSLQCLQLASPSC